LTINIYRAITQKIYLDSKCIEIKIYKMVSTDSLQLHFKNKSYFKIAIFYFNFLVGKNKKQMKENQVWEKNDEHNWKVKKIEKLKKNKELKNYKGKEEEK
jgi:hypothetical protein